MKILMVCLGNICRSPLAEGILSKMVKEENLNWEIDSAGTGSWHIGESPHHGSVEVAAKNDIDITQQRARQFSKSDFSRFDLILAMDAQNYRDILALTSEERDKKKVELILNYSHPKMNMAVPDPYFTGGFGDVFSLLEEACRHVLNKHKESN